MRNDHQVEVAPEIPGSARCPAPRGGGFEVGVSPAFGSLLTNADSGMRGAILGGLQGAQGNLAVQRLVEPLTVARQEMAMPAEEIKGQDPNVVRMPADTIAGNGKPDGDTAKVMANIAATTTRAMGYLTDAKAEIVMAVDAFRGTAQSQVDGLDFDPADWLGVIPMLVGAVTAVVSTIFPPAAGAGIALGFTASLSANAATIGVKTEAATVKQALKDGIAEFGRVTNDAASVLATGAANKLGPKLTDMAATEPGIWDMLLVGGERQQDELISRLGVPNAKQQSPYGPVLSSLMQAFGGWLAKEKYERGMTKYEKLISEMVPYADSYKERRAKIAEGEAAGAAAATRMTEDHSGRRR